MAIVSVEDLHQRQHPDGSFGAQRRPEDRIVATIFAARSLREAGLNRDPSLGPALDFLTSTAIRGGCTIDGRRDGVLSCYTGMLARLLIGSGRQDAAQPLLDWIITYQPVTFGDTVYLQPSAPSWGGYLRHRFGGCMAQTTCLLGLVPSIGALIDARDAGLELPVGDHLDAMRQLLTDRRLMHSRDGHTIIPLAGRTKADPAGSRWLLPAFPRDYVIDLVELVELAIRLGVPDESMTDAASLIKSWRLADGTWPLLGTRRIADAYRPEPVNRRRPSPITTSRIRRLGLVD